MRSDRRAWTPRVSRMAGVIVVLSALWGCPPPDPPAEDVPENEDLDPAPNLRGLDDSEARAALIDGEGDQVGAITFTGAQQEAVRVHRAEIEAVDSVISLEGDAESIRGLAIRRRSQPCAAPPLEAVGRGFFPAPAA